MAAPDSKDKNKKPEMLEKILQGKISKRMNEMSLLGQSHVVVGNVTVEKHLKDVSKSIGSPIGVLMFHKWGLGSSLTKTESETA